MGERPILVPLGGFLGAGKTTLIIAAARLLRARGLRAAAILNDQGAELVDTRLTQSHGVDAEQVTGGCFCCRFSELIEAAGRLSEFAPHVIFAEAVGSCTDISATTLQPLKRHYADRLRLGAYSVLVDPQRAHELMKQGADADLAFLFRKQIEEADLLCYTKADLGVALPELAGAPVRALSARTGDGVAAWLDEVLGGQIEAGSRILDIDYARYAQAEASLAWLNCRVEILLELALSAVVVVGTLLEALDAALTSAEMNIVHLKLMDDSAGGALKASILKNGSEPVVEGMLDASPALSHELLLNVRATGSPAVLRRVVEAAIVEIPGKVEISHMQCFSPAAPEPEYRYA